MLVISVFYREERVIVDYVEPDTVVGQKSARDQCGLFSSVVRSPESPDGIVWVA